MINAPSARGCATEERRRGELLCCKREARKRRRGVRAFCKINQSQCVYIYTHSHERQAYIVYIYAYIYIVGCRRIGVRAYTEGRERERGEADRQTGRRVGNSALLLFLLPSRSRALVFSDESRVSLSAPVPATLGRGSLMSRPARRATLAPTSIQQPPPPPPPSRHHARGRPARALCSPSDPRNNPARADLQREGRGATNLSISSDVVGLIDATMDGGRMCACCPRALNRGWNSIRRPTFIDAGGRGRLSRGMCAYLRITRETFLLPLPRAPASAMCSSLVYRHVFLKND